MICYNCKGESSDNYKYCIHCGRLLNPILLCSTCGSKFVHGYSFCLNCPGIIEDATIMNENGEYVKATMEQISSFLSCSADD